MEAADILATGPRSRSLEIALDTDETLEDDAGPAEGSVKLMLAIDEDDE